LIALLVIGAAPPFPLSPLLPTPLSLLPLWLLRCPPGLRPRLHLPLLLQKRRRRIIIINLVKDKVKILVKKKRKRRKRRRKMFCKSFIYNSLN
jgi:hypothetical protein